MIQADLNDLNCDDCKDFSQRSKDFAAEVAKRICEAIPNDRLNGVSIFGDTEDNEMEVVAQTKGDDAVRLSVAWKDGSEGMTIYRTTMQGAERFDHAFNIDYLTDHLVWLHCAKSSANCIPL